MSIIHAPTLLELAAYALPAAATFARRKRLNRRGFGRAKSQWGPTVLGPDLGAWWDADPLYITLAVSEVSGWADRSGNGNDLQQTTDAIRPTYQSTGWNGNKPKVLFVRANLDTLTLTSGGTIRTFLSGTGVPFTIFGAIQQVSTGGTNDTIAGWGRNATTSGRVRVRNDNVSYLIGQDFGDAGASNQIIGTSAPTTDRKFFALVRNSSTLGSIQVDATLERDSTAWNSTAVTLDNFAMGCSVVAGVDSFHWDGGISELVVVRRAMSSAELMNAYNYIKAKWGGIA